MQESPAGLLMSGSKDGRVTYVPPTPPSYPRVPRLNNLKLSSSPSEAGPALYTDALTPSF
eukprot:523827-Rhodomonas_salina.1